MAQAPGAHSSYDEPIATGGNREDLSDVIHDVSPLQTPGLTAIKKGSATGTSHDWLTDALEAPADNAYIEGADTDPTPTTGDTPADPASRSRLSNYTQIFKKHAVVSGTQEKVLKGGGIRSEMAYQVGRRMKAIKRDVERAFFGVDNPKVAGNDTTAREAGSITTYLSGTSWQGPGDGAAPAGNGADADTNGTNRALTEAIFKAALAVLWNQSGGNENVIAMVGQHVRGVISSFTASSTRYVTTDDRKLVASIDVYDGDFHTVTVTPNRYSLAGNCLILDPEYAAIADLRPLHSYDLAKTGDSYRKELVWETTLEICDPLAHINLASLNTA